MFSWEITLLFDLLFALFVAFSTPLVVNRTLKRVLLLTIGFLVWLFIYTTFLRTYDDGVIKSYFVIVLFTGSIIVISLKLSNLNKIVEVMSVVLLLHPIAIFLQLLFPPLRIAMADFLGFERGFSLIADMSIRMLGLSTSYDTSAVLSLSAAVIWILRFRLKMTMISAIALTLSIGSCFFTSRFGIACIIAFLLYYCYPLLMRNFVTGGLLAFASLLFFFYYGDYVVKTISELYYVILDPVNYSITSNSDNYSSGSLNVLLTSHWDPLYDNKLDLFLGCMRRADLQIVSDIGYVKIIYETGILSLVIFGLYYYLLVRYVEIKNNDDFVILNSFLRTLVLLIVAMSFKNRFMFTPGGVHLLLTVVASCLLNYQIRYKNV